MLVVPVYNMMLAPDATLYFRREMLKRASGGKTFDVGEKVILVVARENSGTKDFTSDSFYPIGVAGVITEMNSNGFVVINTQYRVDLFDIYIAPGNTIQLEIHRRPDIDDIDSDVEREKLRNLKEEMRKYSAGFEWGDTAKFFIDQIHSIGMAACVMGPILNTSNEERYEILAEDSVSKRTEHIEKILYEFMEVGRITNEAVSSQQKEYQQRLQEAAIKRQIEHLQKELDEMHPENVSDVEKFSQKIAESGMNETARREAEKVLNRLKQEGRESAESGMLYDYLDFITGLSWKKEEAKHIDLDEAEKILDEDHCGLEKVKKRILQ